MSWSYRSPALFPARYPSALRESVARLGTPILLHSGKPSLIASDAENFRYYRWCLRERPEYDRVLSGYFNLYQFRISTQKLADASILYLTATAKKSADLAALNPHLSDLLAEI